MEKVVEMAGNLNAKEKLWVVFDEFNASSEEAMFVNIICKRHLNGVTIP